MDKSDLEKLLKIISRAWGKNQRGYCFLPWIDREEQRRAGIRRAGFHEGPAFSWPGDREKILIHMAAHQDDDLYWCPSLFEYENRRADLASDERALWADLDEVDPREISDYPPTIAWETSPGRFQALWVLAAGDIQGASWPGNENQRLTYYLGADQSGWDTTQLLRIPSWVNHKLEYRTGSSKPQGRLLWSNGRTYQSDDFEGLPAVSEAVAPSALTDVIVDEAEKVDRLQVLARVKLKISKAVREKIRAPEALGDRSNALWDIERSLADAGCTAAEIVAVVRETVWNKYDGRADEMKRLVLEATKAIASRTPEAEQSALAEQELEEEVGSKRPQSLVALLKNIKPPKWLIEDILTEGGVGFIAGQPKSFKSWAGLDMALSVSTGAPFLDHFRVLNPGPVLYIQEEDALPTLKTRYLKIGEGKRIDRVVRSLDESGHTILEWLPATEEIAEPPINALVQGGMTISEGVWQEWLDEVLTRGMPISSENPDISTPYRLLIIDTLMMVAGDVEENRSQAMTTQIYRPLKLLARKHHVAIQIVAHMRKGADDQREGQRLLGAVANHAWSEDSIYLSRGKTRGVILVTESKSAEGRTFRIDNITTGKEWRPIVASPHREIPEGTKPASTPHTDHQQKLLDIVAELGTPTSKEVADYLGHGTSGFTHNALKRLHSRNLLGKIEGERPIRWQMKQGR